MHSDYYGSIIGGEEIVDDSATFDCIDPATNLTVAKIHRADSAVVDAAVENSWQAFPAWRDLDGAERAGVMLRVADALEAQFDLLAHLESLDNGKPLLEAEGDVRLTINYYRYFAGLADKTRGDTLPLGRDIHAYTRLEPFGVTAHIVPWNAALQQSARSVAPAIAAGNTAIIKPAEDTSLAVVEFAKIAVAAGLPAGVVNVVTGYGVEAGAALASHPDVRKVAFTGSVATGQQILEASKSNLAPVTLELGGKSPNVVFADADLDAAATSSLRAINFCAGQVCMAGSRLLVQRQVHDELVAKMIQLNGQVTLGRGLDNPTMGPITTAAQFEKIQDYLKVGVAEGAEAVSGGSVATVPGLEEGRFIQPTIFTGVQNSMRIAQEEIFGPVLSVIVFDNEDEALLLANDTPYGLAAGVWTRDLSRAHRVAAGIEAGQVAINNYFANTYRSPFGGYKSSGHGREKGPDAILHYLQSKTVAIQL